MKLRKHTGKRPQVFLVPDRVGNLNKRLIFAYEFLHGTLENNPGVALGYTNAQPLGRKNTANAPPQGLTACAVAWGRADGHSWN